MAGGIAYTREYTATATPDMILGRDGNRLELSIYNTDIDNTNFLYIGFGDESETFSIRNSLPLAPGEAYDASVPPLSSVWLMTAGEPVECVVYYSTEAPGYVRGTLSG